MSKILNEITKSDTAYWIGLTGGIASGKSAVGAMLESYGATVIDADQVARQVVEPGRPELAEIASTFGEEFIQADGYLDRRKLRERVFSSDSDRQTLEKILHGAIRLELLQQAAASNSAYTVLMVPILNKLTLGQYLDQTVVVDCDESQQLARLIERDNMTDVGAKAMMDAQESRQTRLATADIVLNNNSDFAALKQQAEALHLRLSAAANR